MGSYNDIDNQDATWFIDPPYFNGGQHYPFSNKDLDFNELGNWCKERIGEVIVCENDNATWLPFEHLKELWGSCKKSNEDSKSNTRNIRFSRNSNRTSLC